MLTVKEIWFPSSPFAAQWVSLRPKFIEFDSTLRTDVLPELLVWPVQSLREKLRHGTSKQEDEESQEISSKAVVIICKDRYIHGSGILIQSIHIPM